MMSAFTINRAATPTTLHRNEATISGVARGVLPVVDLFLTLRQAMRVVFLEPPGAWNEIHIDVVNNGIGIASCCHPSLSLGLSRFGEERCDRFNVSGSSSLHKDKLMALLERGSLH